MANLDKEKSTEKPKNFLRRIAENEKHRRILLIVGIAAILLIFVSGYFKKDNKSDGNQAAQTAVTQTALSAEDYTQQMESNLTALVNGIDGVGDADVMVTLEKGVEYVYATEEKKSKQTTEDKASDTDIKNQEHDNVETSYIIVKDSDGAQKALAVTEVQPVVKGVVVVCGGGDNPTVQKNVTDAVTTALNISSARVCVVKSK